MSKDNPLQGMFDNFFEVIVDFERQKKFHGLTLEECLDTDGIPFHFKKEYTADMRGQEFGTLRHLYPQDPNYGANCRRISSMLNRKKPKNLDDALELIRDGMEKRYHPLLRKYEKNQDTTEVDFGRWRTPEDGIQWHFGENPRYYYADAITGAEYASDVLTTLFKSLHDEKHHLFPKKLDNQTMSYFAVLNDKEAVKRHTPRIIYVLPKVGSEEWKNCQKLCNHYYLQASDKERPIPERLEAAFRCYYAFSSWAPFRRGSSTTAMLLLSHLTHEMGLVLPAQGVDKDLNVIAICTPFEKFYRDVQMGKHYDLELPRADLRTISRSYGRRNNVYEAFNKNDLVWPELLHDLHHYANNDFYPPLHRYGRALQMAQLPADDPKSLELVTLKHKMPALLIKTKEAYDQLYKVATTSLTMKPPKAPAQFPICIDMHGNRHSEAAIVTRGPVPNDEKIAARYRRAYADKQRELRSTQPQSLAR